MKLYNLDLSGNSYKVRLFLSLLGQDCRIQDVDVMGGEHKQPAFLKLNPKGQVPVLEDAGMVLSDSQAILVYLARRYADESWYPDDAVAQAQIQFWLSTAANEIARGPADARLVKLFGAGLNFEAAAARAAKILDLMNEHLEDREWLVGDQITIADIAVFPYVALAPDGEISLAAYPAIQAWMDRIKQLPGFVGMPGISLEAAV
ncbi:MAG: glutathione S-transferase [Acidobacteriota bacterium]|nr:glutathione S-transferase [Acidobacteriota bacterium]